MYNIQEINWSTIPLFEYPILQIFNSLIAHLPKHHIIKILNLLNMLVFKYIYV